MAQEIQQTQTTKPVATTQTAQPVGEAKWYKKWWIWLIVVVILGAAGYWFFIR